MNSANPWFAMLLTPDFYICNVPSRMPWASFCRRKWHSPIAIKARRHGRRTRDPAKPRHPVRPTWAPGGFSEPGFAEFRWCLGSQCSWGLDPHACLFKNERTGNPAGLPLPTATFIFFFFGPGRGPLTCRQEATPFGRPHRGSACGFGDTISADPQRVFRLTVDAAWPCTE